MALWDKLVNELIDIVEWLDDTNDTLAYRFERYQNEIKNGAKLVVREGQMAAFINEGQLADVFKPGTYELTTKNLPILATLRGWKYGFNSPFKAEIYFCSTRKFTDLKWGTPGPAMMRDKDFGMVRATAFGIYAIPEISMVGKNEEELTREDVPYAVGIARYREIARGQLIGDETGMLKLLFHRQSRELLGVHAIGEGATELIHIGQAVMAYKGKIEYFIDTVFNYPTLAECYKVAALDGINRLPRPWPSLPM